MVDLRGVENAEAQALRLATVEAARPFDLAAGPLLRARLLRLGDTRHLLVLTMHHIISDGWSVGVMVREVGALYPAFRAGQPSPLPELPLQYGDFAAWQRDWLKGEQLDTQLQWWRQQLAGAPELELPTDFPRPRQPRHVAGHAELRLSRELSSAVTELCRREGITPFIALLAAFQVVLGRYAGQDDIVVGSPSAGREDEEVAGLVGFFLNTLVLRTRLSGDPTLRELLGRVRQVSLDAFAHQHIPFEHLQPPRDGRGQLFRVMFMMQNLAKKELELPGLTVRTVQLSDLAAKFDLTLVFTEEPEGFRGGLEYDAELFEPATAEQLLKHLHHVVAAMVARPEGRLSRLALLGEDERHRVLREWSGPREDFPDGTTLGALIREQARRAPDAVAAVTGGQQLTYAQLEHRANGLARRLRREGVGPESLVGVCVERSVELVVALVGILHAGGAYLPLDPSLPRERLSFMLEDSGARALVTQQPLLARFPRPPARVLLLDTQREELEAEGGEPVDGGATARNTAYVIYTSGSTGQPKGVLVEHRGVCNLVAHEARAYQVGPGTRMLQFANLGFDISVEEIFTTLCAGGTLYLAPLERLMPGEPLHTFLREQAITAVSLTPAALAVTEATELPALRTVISGGEACSADIVARWGAGRRFLNTYGPTEGTVVATLTVCEPDGRAPSIGRPLANVEAYVLDAGLEPVPPGVPGELYLGGVGVARGYLGRPGLTAERFVPHPFSREPGARLYRTGDRVKWRANGELDFLGRVDTQVKVRGFRIELGEVESALAAHPAVREAVVVVREDGATGKRLVGYAVPAPGHALEVEELRQFLKQRLPEYMVPAALVRLDALPLTPNGKVDRKALPAPDAAAEARRDFVAPRTPTEQVLAEQWRTLLGVERVGLHDDFFALGGHSLIATQAVARLRGHFGIDLPLRVLFEAATLEELARRVDEALAAGQLAGLPAPRPVPREAALPLSFAQQRLWFLDQLQPGAATYNIPVALRLEGPLDTAALERAFTEVVRRHESLRTTFADEGGAPIQVIHAPAPLPLPLVDLSAHEDGESEALRLARQETTRPFDLAAGPLLRARLLKLGDTRHVLLLTMHHIVSDGWSMGVLVREMAALYEAFRAGQPSPLPELPLQYADVAVWQREWLRGEVLEAQLAWWRKHLEGAPHALELPTDLPRPSVQTFRGASVPVRLSRELSDGLRAFCQQEGVTPFMALLAAFQALLSRYSGQQDLVIGSPIAGRRFAELEGLIGFFVNTLALRSRLDGAPSFRELLRRVRETTLGAYAHQDVPFEKLVEELHPARDLGRAPVFQVFFALQNMPLPAGRESALSIRPFTGVETTAAKFELELELSGHPEGFSGVLVYNADLFLPATARRLARYYAQLVERLLEQPGQPLHRLPLLPEEERRAILVDFNRAPSTFPVDATMPEVFSRVVAARPDAIALESAERRLTYAQLDAAANQLAHLLVARGVRADAPVALALERSVELVVSLLAILKAGGAYLPLDTSYPRERLEQMIEDAQPVLLLTSSSLAGSIPSSASLPVVCVDAVDTSSRPTHTPPVALLPEHLAYIDFTSGSTGRPKGVAVSHRNVLRTVCHAPYADVTADHSFLLIAPISFDASTLEVWGPLLNGGRLVVFPPSSPSDLDLLSSVLREHSVSTLHLTAGLFSQMVENRLDGLRGVKQLLTGGDVVSAPHVRRVLEGLRIPVTACYGPTEGTLFTSCFRMTAPEQVPASIPIGTPITGTQVYLLDESAQPVPVGVPGELFIGGEGLARGYVRRPDLTAERFIPNPFSATPGARLYRTGDLARWRQDGVLEFLGRKDFQVKVRGFRIELAEVEAALLAFAGVREAVALAREDVPGDKRLVGYVTADASLDMNALREALKARLPEYMVPSALVRLDALPLTANAKVDRKALPAPDSRAELRPYEPPRTATEQRLAALWAQVLRVDRVGLHDGFFELGGHSLLATQLVSRVRESFAVELPLRALFEAPTVATLAARLESARPGEQTRSAPPLVPVPRTGELPLSFAQQRLWLLDQLQPGGAAYNIPTPVRLTGKLDTAALERGLTWLVERHESLRTTFAAGSSGPVQVIQPVAPISLPVRDLSALPAGERESEARRLTREEGLLPFDLTHGPLFRASLLRLAPEDHVLRLTAHHIVSDGWSTGVLVRELAALYAAAVTGHPPQLPPLPVQYADYSVWQRDWLRGEVLEAQLDYWKQQLGGAPPVLELPTDRPRPAVQTFAGAEHSFTLPAELSQRLEALAREHQATLFMVLLTAWHTLLHRYSGQEDLVVGSPIAGRTHAPTEGLIGFFVNTLALRARLSGTDSFAGLLAQVRETTLGAYAHQEVPFEKLVEVLQPQRDLSRSPLFQVMFSVQNLPDTSWSLPGLELSPLEAVSPVAKFDLTLVLTPGPQGLSGALGYNTDLFDASTAARMVDHFHLLLEAVAAAPHQRLSSLPLLREAEQRQLLVEWNETATPFPDGACIHELFEAQVPRTPDAPALCFGSESLSYRELDTRANRLAHALRSRGVGPDTRVALGLERSLELVVSMLAVLKAGGAYVPLDPAYPRERLAFMLQDCGAAVLLTHSRLLGTLPPFHGHVLALDTEAAALARFPDTAPARTATADQLAYVIYTSGSTGRPKGVAVPHRGVPNLARHMARATGLKPGQRVLQFASFSFDAAVYEVTLALLHGATLVLATREELLPGQPLVDVLRGQSIDSALLPPSVLALLPTEGLETLGTLISGGEACTAEVVAKWAPGRHFINAYGPTESTVIATLHTCVPDGQRPPLGRALSNTRLYVLDGHLRPVPVGVPGELFIGGVGLARGYLGRPELTAERFVPDAFGTTPGGRLYRTGDLVRWRPDGTLEYLGRTDFQVKLRGFRIELGEIEAVLSAQSGVRQALVLVREDRPGDKRLVAYVVGAPGETVDTEALRSALEQRLPGHMVPSAFVALEALPLTPNGKVDRRALPPPEASAAGQAAPRTPTEERLAHLWAQVLGLERVGAEDHFFELGGHSLLATQVISRIRSEFGVELPLRALFEAPVLSALARRVDSALHSHRVQAPPLVPLPRTDDLPLSFAQQRLWFIDQIEPGSSTYNLATVLRLRGPLEPATLEAAFTSLAGRHESLRTTFEVRDGEPVQRIQPLTGVALPMVDLSDLPSEEREAEARRLASHEAERPFDLQRGPLFRALLLRLSPEEHVLIGAMHHIVSDGWSMGVLVRELEALYVAHATGQQARLPALPIQYADFAAWQRSWLRGEALARQLGYWKRQLAGAPAVLELPTDKPRPTVLSSRGAYQPVRFSKPLTEALLALCQREGVTPFMLLLAGWQVLLSRYSGQEDLCVGSPIAGRTRAETEGLIGFFVNTLVLRAQVEPHASFRELLAHVRATTLGAYEHQDVPFEKLVEELRPERSLSHSPLFQVMFALQNTPTASPRVEGAPPLRLEPFDADVQTTKFDLMLTLVQGADGFEGTLGYRTDLFEPSTIRRMVEHLGTLMEAAAATPEAPVGGLSLLPASEREQLLAHWSGVATDYPRASTLPEVFSQVVARHGDRVAIEFGDSRLTYRQLDERANQLAHHLRSLGVSTDSRVAIALERSLELVVALVAILKAGGAYVPLDPAYPRERLATMVEDTRPRALVTTRALLARLPAEGQAAVLMDALSLEGEPAHPPPPAALPESLAYIDFTSGSTGRPKGVGTVHQAVLRTLFGVDYARFGPEETFLLLAPISFDASTFELWGALLHGSRLVIMPPQTPSLEELGRTVQQSGVTTLWLTTGLFTQMVESQLEGMRPVKQVLMGGDIVSAPHVRRVLEELRVPVVHAYGPTESTVFTTAFRLTEPSQAEGATISIGGPLANTRVYVLDAYGQLVPTGVPGELFIGGDGLARGYVEQPGLTAERFVPDAFSGVPGARLYRTGDRVRWRADGMLEFLGRNDFQVKLRGFRIELGEIEAALSRHPAVRQALVLKREVSAGNPQLVAWFTSTGSAPDAATLRAFLQQRLPGYMVPSAFMALESFPLTPNGKVDRKALPTPEVSSPTADFEPPASATEARLATLWAEVLGVEKVGRRDNFFELGGHSLLATQVVSRVRATFDVELPLRALFEAPTLAALSLRIEDARRRRDGAGLPPLLPVPRSGALPLSFAQQRLWFLEQLEPGSVRYNIPTALLLEGRLELPALERAFSELLRRHESLRTTFHADAGEPSQRIHPPAPLRLEVVDLMDLPEAERLGEAQRLSSEDALRPFNLSTGPLLRTTLLRLSEHQHALLLNLHHAVSDGWSMGVLVREVATLYEAFAAGLPSPLPELPVQYADYAVWQREWLRGEVLEAQLGWWRQQLSGAPPHLELPTDFPRPPVLSHRGATVPVRLPLPLSEPLKALAQREGATPFMLLLAAFQLLLSRYSGQEDVVIGSPIAGRRHAETEGLIGFFVNTLVLRSRPEGHLSFLALLRQVRETTLGAYEHQDLPFEKLVEALQPARDLSRSPLFQVLFVLQNTPVREAHLPSLSFRPLEAQDTEAAKFELSLNLAETSEGFLGELRFNADLFAEASARRMVRHLEVLLETLVSTPDVRLSELSLLTAGERQQVLRAWNDTASDATPESCFHHAFELQAARTPAAPAVSFEESVLSFAGLNTRANQLAHHLRALGVGADVPVALCFERSVEMVVALLAVMKAGGAYVPLDPAWPTQRLGFTLRDCAASVLLTQQRLDSSWAPAGTHVLSLDSADALPASLPSHDPAPSASADNLAYVIYTSGSTGTPKGVMVRHRSVLNLRHALARTVYAGQPSGMRVSVNAPLAFDASVKQLVQLLDGHCLCIVPEASRQDPEAMREWLRRHHVDVLDCTPSLLRLLVQSGLLQDAAAPRLLVPGGEAIDEALWRQLAAAPRTRTFNVYGPTECTVDSTAFAVLPGTRPTIGGPLANVRTYVLDAHLRPVPVGVPGELFISGAGLARGYLRRPALTAERFVADPFNATPGARMYRTGDKVRWREDGTLEYLGRTDFQVKLRGYRIELGEIEAALSQHPAVRQALVLVREDSPGHPRLVAYFTHADAAPDSTTLRAFLQQRLPEYMVPPVFVPLDAFPLTPNGKVDRGALPAPDASALTSATYAAPRTSTELLLASIWAQVLHVEKVGRNDDFFALGGHSLLATQVVARIRSSFNVELPLRALFEAPTLERLALLVEKASHSTGLPAPRPMPREGHPPLSFAQQRLWFLDQLQPGSALYNIPMPLRLEGPLDVSALERAFGELVRRHESLRTTFHAEAGQPVQLIHPPAPFHLPRVDLGAREDREEEARRLVLEELARPFNLATGPLLRVTLVRLAEQQHVLLLNLHHIISDGWSNGVLVREMAMLYEAFTQGRPSPLPELPVQYADYALWQRDWLRGEALERQLGWWKQRLAGAPHALELPTDFSRPPVLSHRGGAVPVHLPRPLSESLKALAQREGATPFMLLLAAWQLLLSRYSGQEDVVVGSPIAGRRHAETEGLIGFFVNTLVLRARIDSRASFRALLSHVRETTLGAYEHQDVPFEKLVEELQPQRDLSRSPLFQAFFVLQNTPMRQLAASELALRPLETEGSAAAKFELNLGLIESPEGFVGQLQFNADLFTQATAARMVAHLQVLLEDVAAHPEAPLSDLALFTPAERQQVLQAWNDTVAPCPVDSTFHQVFEHQADLTPSAPAVRFEEDVLSFGQLNARANQLAHHLRELGVGPDVPVAFCLERSTEAIVALLAIMKAGGGYVPLDPAWPLQRRTLTLQDCGAPVLLTRSALVSGWQPTGAHVLCLDTEASQLASRPSHDPAPVAGPDNLAYVIYTSGSTGTPKGVMIQHRSVLNLRHALARTVYAGQPSGLRVSVNAPLAFDASVKQLVQLLDGHCLCIVPEDTRQDPQAMRQWVRSQGVDVLDGTPSLLRLLVQSGLLQDAAAPRLLVPGGEAIDEALWQQLAAAPRTRTFNVYGPTECTVDSTAFAVLPGTRPTIGGPLANVRTYVLDAHLRPVPVGVPGELFISGTGLARGYLRRPSLTAERFMADPFSATPGARMYRTGDKVRWREDGTLEYLGRTDFQVKLRGYRIELGEIEAALALHPAVHQAVVLVREDVPGDKRLVAYVVPSSGQSADADALRTHVRKSLPEYMVPSAFVLLEALPLTPNGKVDRGALPAPDRVLVTARHDTTAPRDVLEHMLAGIWEELLGIQPVGIRGNFFELGGHSLLAVQLMARIRERTGRTLPLASLFQAPTVEGLASLLRQLPAPFSPLVPIQGDGSQRPLFLVHPVGGNVLGYARLARRLGPDQPVYGLQSQGLDGQQPSLESIEEMAALYLEAIRAIQPRGPYRLGGWSMGAVVAFEMARQLHARGEAVELLALIDPSPATADRVRVDTEDAAQLVAHFARDMAGLAARDAWSPDEPQGRQDVDTMLQRLLDAGREAGLLVPEVGLPQLRTLFEVFAGNLRALARYVPGPFAGRVTMLRATEDAGNPARAVDRGWAALATGGLRLQEVPGNHYSLLREPGVHVLAEHLAALLAG
nr:non-ribosomal peptide synthetase [Pyxidicoccus fallax]